MEPSAVPQRGAMYAALAQLAEQDPLIDLRRDDSRGEVALSLFGEVQKEVVQATLAAEYGVEVTFRETTTICVERLVGAGAAYELIGVAPNPFLATVGLRGGTGAGRQRGQAWARGRAGLDAARVLRPPSRSGARHAAAGPAGLAGTRLRGDDDALRLLRAAEPRARHVRRPDVQHGRGLPSPDAAGADDGADPGRAGCSSRSTASELEIPQPMLGAVLSALSRLRAVPLRDRPRWGRRTC